LHAFLDEQGLIGQDQGWLFYGGVGSHEDGFSNRLLVIGPYRTRLLEGALWADLNPCSPVHGRPHRARGVAGPELVVPDPDRSTNRQIWDELVDVYRNRTTPPPTSEIPALARAWRAFVEAERTRFRDGSLLHAGDPSLPTALIPSTWSFTLSDGTTWPSR